MSDVRIDNLSFTYPGSSQPVLHALNLTIPEGEFMLLAGPSGGGKSTLALALAGLIPSRIGGRLQGAIYLGDKNVSAMDTHEASQHIGIVFQNPDEQLIHLDVEAEVAFGPENLALPPMEIEQRVEEALTYTGMKRLRRQEIFALSGGQKQRVAIAATLAMRSRVLVLDEPTSDLDPVGTQEVLSVLRTLNQQYGITIVLIEHKIDEVVPWVDRVVLMKRGRIVVDTSPRQAFDNIPLWRDMGVSVPQVVLLSRVLPDVFQGVTPLSVDEAYEALRGTPYVQRLLQRSHSDERPISPAYHTSTQSVLSWEGVDLAYGKKQVLTDINLKVMPQEWIALIGPNGSGKTSLASLAMGFQPPTRGVIYHKGKRVETGQISRQAEHIAYLFQSADNMLFTATVEQELLFGEKHQHRRRVKIPYELDQLLEIIDLVAYRQRNPFHLSHGERKRLAIGALLTRHPDVLLLDEPTTGQDEGHVQAFLLFLQQLRERESLTYLMITHNMEAVARYASRVVVLKDTRVFLDDTPESVFARLEELALCGILPPPIAHLHARLCEGQATHVALSVNDFLLLLQPLEAVS
ncbi:MAG: ATP-binding cassette domain-containing protein [Chloroflexi bacterium]|nr:ATP-binding cassette domain-containing protein [Chloroflexota bacterium]